MLVKRYTCEAYISQSIDCYYVACAADGLKFYDVQPGNGPIAEMGGTVSVSHSFSFTLNGF